MAQSLEEVLKNGSDVIKSAEFIKKLKFYLAPAINWKSMGIVAVGYASLRLSDFGSGSRSSSVKLMEIKTGMLRQ